MKIGLVRETKTDERRVALTSAGVETLVNDGHVVLVQSGAGEGSFITDGDYAGAGAQLVGEADQVWSQAELIVKVKEPQPDEFDSLAPGTILFTYLHLAAYPRVADVLRRREITSIGYETVRLADGTLPLLAPMSEVAGRMSIQLGARFLESYEGGRGILLAGVPGVPPGRVVIIGAGSAGCNAVQIAVGMGAEVAVFDLNPAPLRHLDQVYHGRITTGIANPVAVRDAVAKANLVIGAALIPGARAPRVLTAEDVRAMKPGSVVLDLAIDQGGCFETSRETTHTNPTFAVDDVVHYAVGNIPGAVPRTSTYALTNSTLPYLRLIAGRGLDEAMELRPELKPGLNTHRGQVVNEAVRTALAS